MRHGRLATLAAGTALAALALPAAAPAATVGSNTPCVRAIPGVQTWQAITSGFTPGQSVRVLADDQSVAAGVADPAGNFVAATFAPSLESNDTNEQAFTLTAADGAGVAATPAPLQVVRLIVDLPDRARPRSRVSYRAYGFEPGKDVFLHIRRSASTQGRFNLGEAEGDCGKTSKKMRYMPLDRYRTGTYDYWFSQSRRYSRATRIYGVKITIFRRLRTSAAAAGAASASTGAATYGARVSRLVG